MKLSYIPDSLWFLGLEDMLDTVHSMEINFIELTTGNWSRAPHADLEKLTNNQDARKVFADAFYKRGMDIVALNCSGKYQWE